MDGLTWSWTVTEPKKIRSQDDPHYEKYLLTNYSVSSLIVQRNFFYNFIDKLGRLPGVVRQWLCHCLCLCMDVSTSSYLGSVLLMRQRSSSIPHRALGTGMNRWALSKQSSHVNEINQIQVNNPNDDNMELLYWLIHQAPLLKSSTEIVVGGRESDTWLI